MTYSSGISSKIRFYYPVHANISQAEHVLPFLQSTEAAGGVILYYDWNPDADKLVSFFKDVAKLGDSNVRPFTVRNFIESMLEERRAGNKVVIVLTSSPGYGFGAAQRVIFTEFQKMFSDTIIDIFPVGHCLYGCESHSFHEHQVPVYFTRFINKTLPYNTEDVRRKYCSSSNKTNILVSPSFGNESFLGELPILEYLANLDKTKYNTVAKLHGLCMRNDEDIARHESPMFLLHSLDPEQKDNVEYIKRTFRVVPEVEHNILPFLDAFDIVVCDINSSVPFEALYFHPRLKVFAYHPDHWILKDEEFRKSVHTFKSVEELERLLQLHTRGELPPTADGKRFFRSKYGDPDGKEVLRIATERHWTEADVLEKSSSVVVDDDKSDSDEILECLYEKFAEHFPPYDTASTAFYALGDSAFARFLDRYRGQLISLNVPQHLWRVLHRKLEQSLFDAGDYFQILVNEDESEIPDGIKNKFKVVVIKEQGIKKEQDIWLVDHAWTFQRDQAEQYLRSYPALLDRVARLMGLVEDDQEEQENDDDDDEGQEDTTTTTTTTATTTTTNSDAQQQQPKEDAEEQEDPDTLLKKVLVHLPQFEFSYAVKPSSDAPAIETCFIHDEFGSRFRTTTTTNPANTAAAAAAAVQPNFRFAWPFLYSDPAMGLVPFTLLWPTADVAEGDEAVCNARM